jgi:hypothetical protein
VVVIRCACGHAEELHHPAGRCAVTLPAFLEEELPAWSCPCRKLRPAAGPWRWHTASATWQAVA